MMEESANSKIDQPAPEVRRSADYLYQGAILAAALLLVLSATV
jgi:hypothetical protein